jgi:hypothetical protein
VLINGSYQDNVTSSKIPDHFRFSLQTLYGIEAKASMILTFTTKHGFTMKCFAEALVPQLSDSKVIDVSLHLKSIFQNIKIDCQGNLIPSIEVHTSTEEMSSVLNNVQLTCASPIHSAINELKSYTLSQSSRNEFEETVYFLFSVFLLEKNISKVLLAQPIEIPADSLFEPEVIGALKGISFLPQADGLCEISLPALLFLKYFVSYSNEPITFDRLSYSQSTGQKVALFVKNGSINSEKEHIDSEMLMIEANIDDCQGEWMGYTMELLLENGANDVFFTPIVMKKNRPAYKLSVLTQQTKLTQLEKIIFKETTSFGVRYFPVTCRRLERKFEQVETEWGTVSIKIGLHLGEVVQVSAEYEDCKKIAQQYHLPIGKVYEVAIQQFQRNKSSSSTSLNS